MDTLIGKICPFCQKTINEGDSVIVCPSCNIPHHENCWNSHGGCTTPGCLYQPENNIDSVLNDGFDLSDQLDEIDFAPELPADVSTGNKPSNTASGGLDLSAAFMPTQIDTSHRTAGKSDAPKGLNRSIRIMSFMENHIEEGEKEYSQQREEKIKLGKQSLSVMNFTDENAVKKAQAEEAASQQKTSAPNKPQQTPQSQHKASLTKPNQNRSQPAQKPNQGAGTKANLSKAQPNQQTKASLTKPNANAKPSLQKPSDAKPVLSKNGKPAANNKIDQSSNKAQKKCTKCQRFIPVDKDFCPYCGTAQKATEKPQINKKTACDNCGSLVRADQVFCPRCGKRIVNNPTRRDVSPSKTVSTEEVDASVNSAVSKFSDALEQSRKKNRKRLFFTGAATLLLVIAVLIAIKATDKKDFSGMFSDLEKNSWCTITDNGMTMKIDTNPDDKPDEKESMAYSQIKDINKKLGFTENIYRNMGSTRAADGERYATFRNFKVTWKYHPDSGLEVVYTMK